MSSYDVVYGPKPPSVASYLPCTFNVQLLDRTLNTRVAILHTLKDNLALAQNRMKQWDDQHCSECSFAKGD
jgi:hypothetical protein